MNRGAASATLSSSTASGTRHPAWLPALVAAAFPFVYYAFQRNVGLSLSDEGYLWYGVQRVLAGEVPFRDFQAYDVGRYYFAAAIMAMLHDHGIVALRAANAALLSIAVALGTYLVARRNRGLALPLLAAASLFAWMFPEFKAADFVAPIALVAAFVAVIEEPRPMRLFACGVVIGLVAILGRNHGIYGVAGSVLLFAYVFGPHRGRGGARALASWSAGVVAGYSPMLVMLAVTPGLAKAFADSVRFLFEYSGTNIPLPVPRPWAVPIRHDGWIPLAVTLQELSIAVLFMALPLFGLVAVILAFARHTRGKHVDPLFAAAALLVLPYAHYALSRAEQWHLAFGILPFIIAVLAFPLRGPRTRRAVALATLAVSVLVVVPLRPGIREARDGGWPTVQVLGDRLRVDRDTAADIRLLTTLAARFAPGDTPFLAVPFWPGACAVFARRSPMWDIYPTIPRSERAQQAEIERIRRADPGFVVVSDIALDGRDERRFRNTLPLIDAFIRASFRPVTDIDAPAYLRIYRRNR